jgi:hypothetical protein
MPVLHYFGLAAAEARGEFNFTRDGFDPRIVHTMFLRYAIDGLSDEAIAECAKIGYRPDDFRSALFAPPSGRGVWLLSVWADSIFALYRHKRLGFRLPWARPFEADHAGDARAAPLEALPKHQRSNWIAPALRRLQADYEHVGLIGEAEFKDNLDRILSRAPRGTPVAILKRVDRLIDNAGSVQVLESARRFNGWLDDVAAAHRCVRLFDVRDCATPESEIKDWLHFDRLTYHRLFLAIRRTLSSTRVRSAAPAPVEA